MGDTVLLHRSHWTDYCHMKYLLKMKSEWTNIFQGDVYIQYRSDYKNTVTLTPITTKLHADKW